MRARRSRITHVQALTLKSGPTQSGAVVPPGNSVGGELLGADKLSVFLSNYWLLVVLVLLLPIALLVYRKRETALGFLMPLLRRF